MSKGGIDMDSEEYKKMLIDQFLNVLSEMTYEEICDVIERHDIQTFLERMI